MPRVESQPRLRELTSRFLSQSNDTDRKRSLSKPTILSGTKRLSVMVEKMIEVCRPLMYLLYFVLSVPFSEFSGWKRRELVCRQK